MVAKLLSLAFVAFPALANAYVIPTEDIGSCTDTSGVQSVTVEDKNPGSTDFGWDMKTITLSLDPSTEELTVDITCKTACGDADGDNDPDAATIAFASTSNYDAKELGGMEYFYCTFTAAGVKSTFGVSSYLGSDSTGVFRMMNGDDFFPATAVIADPPTLKYTPPTTNDPNFKFSLTPASKIPGWDNNGFSLHCSAGSAKDDVGEESIDMNLIPLPCPTPAPTPSPTASPTASPTPRPAPPPPPPPPTPPGGCHPQCKWLCDDPVCPAKCHPVCARPKCMMDCKPTECAKCEVHCEDPVCSVRCPKEMCELEDCPACETICRPAVCRTTCTAPQPNCAPHCEQTKCAWKCKTPELCPKPKCQLTCEKPSCSEDKVFKGVSLLETASRTCCDCTNPDAARAAILSANQHAESLGHQHEDEFMLSVEETRNLASWMHQEGMAANCCPCV